MAKPSDFTPAQEEALKKKLNVQDLTSIYEGMSEEGVRRLAGMPPAAAPVIGSVIPPKPMIIPLVKTDSGRITTEADGKSVV